MVQQVGWRNQQFRQSVAVQVVDDDGRNIERHADFTRTDFADFFKAHWPAALRDANAAGINRPWPWSAVGVRLICPLNQNISRDCETALQALIHHVNVN